MVPGKILDYIVAREAKETTTANDEESAGTKVTTTLTAPIHLKWDVRPDVQTLIDKALINNQSLIDDIDLSVLIVPNYGSDKFKQCIYINIYVVP